MINRSISSETSPSSSHRKIKKVQTKNTTSHSTPLGLIERVDDLENFDITPASHPELYSQGALLKKKIPEFLNKCHTVKSLYIVKLLEHVGQTPLLREALCLITMSHHGLSDYELSYLLARTRGKGGWTNQNTTDNAQPISENNENDDMKKDEELPKRSVDRPGSISPADVLERLESEKWKENSSEVQKQGKRIDRQELDRLKVVLSEYTIIIVGLNTIGNRYVRQAIIGAFMDTDKKRQYWLKILERWFAGTVISVRKVLELPHSLRLQCETFDRLYKKHASPTPKMKLQRLNLRAHLVDTITELSTFTLLHSQTGTRDYLRSLLRVGRCSPEACSTKIRENFERVYNLVSPVTTDYHLLIKKHIIVDDSVYAQGNTDNNSHDSKSRFVAILSDKQKAELRRKQDAKQVEALTKYRKEAKFHLVHIAQYMFEDTGNWQQAQRMAESAFMMIFGVKQLDLSSFPLTSWGPNMNIIACTTTAVKLLSLIYLRCLMLWLALALKLGVVEQSPDTHAANMRGGMLLNRGLTQDDIQREKITAMGAKMRIPLGRVNLRSYLEPEQIERHFKMFSAIMARLRLVATNDHVNSRLTSLQFEIFAEAAAVSAGILHVLPPRDWRSRQSSDVEMKVAEAFYVHKERYVPPQRLGRHPDL